MQYDASQIKLKNIPALHKDSNGNCSRTYFYSFQNKLPEQNTINLITNSLSPKFRFSQDELGTSEDIEIFASVFVKRLADYEAHVGVKTPHLEESCIYIFGIHTLPRKLEEVLGTVRFIQGQSRSMWIY